MPGGPGVLREKKIAEIAAAVPPPIGTFLLTSKRAAGDVVAQQRRCRTNTVQLCDRLESGSYEELRRGMPGVSIVQVIHVNGEASIREAVQLAPYVDAILLDSGNASLPVKEMGGRGRVHDWRISRSIRDQVGIPIFLAGGLNAENIADAVRYVGPFGLDICNGVRADGNLSELKLAAIFRAVRRSLE